MEIVSSVDHCKVSGRMRPDIKSLTVTLGVQPRTVEPGLLEDEVRE